MKFRLDHTPTPASFKIAHADQLLLLGSCFSENIGQKLVDYRFRSSVNPGGIAFNPLSVASLISSALHREGNRDDLLLQRGDRYFSYQHHSSVKAASKKELAHFIKNIQDQTRETLKDASAMFISFGTAFAYRHKESREIVSNCHKQPASIFDK